MIVKYLWNLIHHPFINAFIFKSVHFEIRFYLVVNLSKPFHGLIYFLPTCLPQYPIIFWLNHYFFVHHFFFANYFTTQSSKQNCRIYLWLIPLKFCSQSWQHWRIQDYFNVFFFFFHFLQKYTNYCVTNICYVYSEVNITASSLGHRHSLLQ